jgi:succinate dehydrogenase/fumarate reductase-like Fe-S protein
MQRGGTAKCPQKAAPSFIVCFVACCRWIIDSRDEFTAERLAQLDDAYKLYRCKVGAGVAKLPSALQILL